MSNHSEAPHVYSPGGGRESMTTATTEKYPASSASGYQSYPEVAPQMTQPGLQSYQAQPQPQPPHTGYAQPQYQQQNGYAPQAAEPAPQAQKRNPWGMSPLAFGLLIAAITAVIVGAAVGGGVAGAMSGNNDKSSNNDNSRNTSTSTVTITTTATGTSTSTGTNIPLPSSLENYVVAEPFYVSTLENPGCSISSIEVQYSTIFDLFCGVDMQNQIADETSPNLQVADVVGLFAYSLTDCLYACVNAIFFEEQWGNGLGGCKSVTWQYEMASSNSSNNANCWLKNGTSSGHQCNTCISAKLAT